MGDLARCPNPECRVVLDIPELEYTWRQIDGQCASCHEKNPGPPMQLPPEVIRAVKGTPGQPAPTYAEPAAHKPSRVLRKAPPTQSPPPPDTGKFAVDSSVVGPDSFQIESGVPLDYVDPADKVYRGKYPFPAMKPPRKGPGGTVLYDSFLVPYDGKDPVSVRSAVYQALKAYRDHYAPLFRATCKQLRDGVRVWRVEDSEKRHRGKRASD